MRLRMQDGQHEEIHHHLKALHVLQSRADRGAESRKDERDEPQECARERRNLPHSHSIVAGGLPVMS